ncbi:MAG: MoaD/ThiS family protein [Verrucomicrobiota bacterium]
MTFSVCYFGLLAERRGVAEERVTTAATTPAGLFAELGLGVSISGMRAAVNDEFVPWDQPLNDGDRVALLPPMSGG